MKNKWHVMLATGKQSRYTWNYAWVTHGGALALSDVGPDTPEMFYAPGAWTSVDLV